jgi:hypothetical protein
MKQVATRSQTQNYISNLETDLIGHALELLQERAYPVYKRNIDKREPPFAHGEFGPSAIAALLLTSGVDYHLARLKWLRDIAVEDPPLPHTPYFNWKIDNSLKTKIECLLQRPSEKRLREQLLELTSMRDSVAHPKLYIVKQLWKPDDSIIERKADLADGVEHRSKTIERKLKRSERTISLRLPLVATWISYVDMVICVLVVNRFLNLLQEKYDWYASPGSFSVRNIPAGFFSDWGATLRKSIQLEEWAQAFFNSLAPTDQLVVQKRLGVMPSKYIERRIKDFPLKKRLRNGEIEYELQDTPKPEFLRKPPPWPMNP